jgi:hypothetical protein
LNDDDKSEAGSFDFVAKDRGLPWRTEAGQTQGYNTHSVQLHPILDDVEMKTLMVRSAIVDMKRFDFSLSSSLVSSLSIVVGGLSFF